MRIGESLLLDADVIIALFRQDENVRKVLGRVSQTYIPVIAAGELLAGVMRADRVAAETARVEEFFSIGRVIDCDLGTAYHFAAVRDGLRRRGKPIPENDMWIAALARQHDLTLAKRDVHYDCIDGLRIEACRN